MKRTPKHPALVPGGPWHQLASGKPFALVGEPTPLTIEDVAASLSKICRFAGACREFYSVAQHSVLVSAIVAKLCRDPEEEPETVIAALLHDAAEMVIGDIPRPIKMMLPGIGAIEDECLHRIGAGLGLWNDWSYTDFALLKRADEIALATEKAFYMASSKHSWGKLPKSIIPSALGLPLSPLSPPEAERLFLATWRSAFDRFEEWGESNGQ